jgi:hypothetical protein
MRPIVLGGAHVIGLLLPSSPELEPVPHAAASEQSPDLLCLSSGCHHVHVNTWNTSGHRHHETMRGRSFDIAEEVGAHAHHWAQAWVGERLQ